MRPSVALVVATNQDARAAGTAFVTHSDGLLVTALHVIEAAREIRVTFPGRATVPAEVVGVDPDNDVAVLRVPTVGLPALSVATRLPRLGEDIVVLGFPLVSLLGQYDLTVTRGVISGLRPELGVVQIDASINPGVSGGPVVTPMGEVVGMVVARLEGQQQVNFAVPGTLLAQLLSRLSDSPTSLAALQPPFLATREQAVTVRKGFPASSSGTELGAQCVSPPRRARSITGVLGSLKIGDVLAIVWLSLRQGVEANHPHAFAHLGADRAWLPPRIPERTRLQLRNLAYPAEVVCVNFTYQASMWVCFLCSFEASYVLEYRVFSAPGF
ncbi:MAG: serine protease [Armatimonadota bacterium]|nr:serine protease [Armatimonadota bacterium]